MGKMIATFSRLKTAPDFRHDTSIQLHPSENGIVDQVLITSNDKDERLVQIRMRSIRVPQMGDKFASRHGQKGTCGMLYTQEDMPFNQEGIVPDLIINPHAIPSRMTIGHLIECLISKVAALRGSEGDATPFSNITVNEIGQELHNHGYHKHGWEVMFAGISGKPLTNMIFIGPTYYQRLKHLVADKIYCRSRGKVTNLTRQPLEGRKRQGGLRFGEMERDCIISHGAASFLRERLLLVSDVYRMHVCSKCGLIAVADFDKKRFFCGTCQKKEISPDSSSQRVFQVMIPYAAKLLFQELMSMLIKPQIVMHND
jgi:DNA-directed RNA polymerase II subunit RPB2